MPHYFDQAMALCRRAGFEPVHPRWADKHRAERKLSVFSRLLDGL